MPASYSSLKNDGGRSSFSGWLIESQFIQFSHWHCFEHLIPFAKQEQYFLLHLVFLQVQYFLYKSSSTIAPFFRFYIASALSFESILLRQSSHLHRDVHTPLLWKHLQYDFRHWLCLQLQNYPLSAMSSAFFIWMQVSQQDYFKQISDLAKKQGHSIPLQVGKQSQVWFSVLS